MAWTRTAIMLRRRTLKCETEKETYLPYMRVTKSILCSLVQFSQFSFSSVQSVQPVNRLDCQGDMTDNSAGILFQSFLQKATVSSSGMKEVLLSTAEKVLGRQEENSTLGHSRGSGSVWPEMTTCCTWSFECMCSNLDRCLRRSQRHCQH